MSKHVHLDNWVEDAMLWNERFNEFIMDVVMCVLGQFDKCKGLIWEAEITDFSTRVEVLWNDRSVMQTNNFPIWGVIQSTMK